MNLQIDGVYVIHAKKGYEVHEQRIVKLFHENNISFEFVTEGDPADFTDNILDKYFTKNVQQKLSKGALSCTLNHVLAYKKIVERNNKYALVFENDPFFLGNFSKKLTALQKEVEGLNGSFIISLENSTLRFPSYFQVKKDKHLYRANSGRMAGAYLINLQAARAILKDLETNKCDDVIDWWHNDLINRGVIKMYWAHPPLTEQGSHNGYLHSTISSKPESFKRRIAWLISKGYKMYIGRMINQKRLVSGSETQ